MTEKTVVGLFGFSPSDQLFWLWIAGGTIIGGILVLHGHFPKIVTLKRIAIASIICVLVALAIGFGWYLGLKQGG